MPVFKDRVGDLSSSTGTDSFLLSNTPPTGYQSFSTAFTANDPFLYCIVDTSTGAWETGQGYLDKSNLNILHRDSVSDGSNGEGIFVDFIPGPKLVFCTVTSDHIKCIGPGVTLATSSGMAMP